MSLLLLLNTPISLTPRFSGVNSEDKLTRTVSTVFAPLSKPLKRFGARADRGTSLRRGVNRILYCFLLAFALGASDATADALDDALASIKCKRADLAIPTDIRWRDPFRLEVIDRLLTKPLDTPDHCQAMAEELANADSLEAILANAARRLEYGSFDSIPSPPMNSGAPKVKQSEELTQALQLLYDGAVAAEAERKKAFAALAKAEYQHLFKNHRDLVTHIRGVENTKLFDEKVLAAARKVDYVALTRAGMIAARSVEAAEKILRGWKPSKDREKLFRSKLMDVNTPLGRIVVGGTGDDTYDGKPVAILIELGGNDMYHCPVGSGIESLSMAIDLQGDDRYESTNDFAFATGDLGVGILLDCDGDDHYSAGNASLGSALFGVGVLVDRAGMDSYNVDEHGEAAANFGIGILLDDAGEDTYLARYFAQAVSGPLGFGLLLDRAGNDTYFVGGKHHGWSTSETSYRSACQGYSQGVREYASGAIALLVDVAGNDLYRGGAICQGVGYWFALGALVDGAGNDNYTCLHYGQAGPFHFGVGALLDNGGDDFYKGDVGTQGMGYDWSAAFLVDYAGNDVHEGYHLSVGSGGVNGVGIFCDNAGDDFYNCGTSFTLGSGQWVDRRAAGSIGVFLDFDGNDRYPKEPYGNEKSWTQQFYGAGLDLKGGTPLFTKAMQAKPVSRPPIASKEDPVATVPDAPNTVAGAKQLFEIMAEGFGSTPRAKKAEEKFLAMGPPAQAVLMEGLVQEPFYLSYGAAYSLLPKFGTNAVPPLLALMKDNDPWSRCRAADVLGLMKPEEAQSALPVLREGLKDDHFVMRTACAQALGKLGDASATGKLSELVVSDPHFSVRLRSAEALGKLKSPEAVPALTKALNDPYYQVRYGAQKALDAIAGKAEPSK
jgi:hypothetical protein